MTVVNVSKSKVDYFKKYGRHLNELLLKLDDQSLLAMCQIFLKARLSNNTIYFAGNGGSAATAAHFAQDLAEVGRKVNKKGFRSLSLTENTSQITAISNDYGYEYVFSIVLQEIFNKEDVLVVISASGNSPNVVLAAEKAKALGGTTVALVGFEGGKLAKICDHVVHIQTPKGEYGPVEDVHMIIDHMVTSFLIEHLKSETVA